MSNTRRIKIADFEEGKLEDIIHNLSVILKEHPTAYVELVWDGWGDENLEISKDVPVTALDLALAEAVTNLCSHEQLRPPSHIVVLNQAMPIEKEVLDKIKEDGKSDSYHLSLGGTMLTRKFRPEEVLENARVYTETLKNLKESVRQLKKLQQDQDKKYLM